MTVKRGGLGRNLSVLLGQTKDIPQHKSALASAEHDHKSMTLAIGQLRPGKYQPRGDIEDQPLEELAQSIRQQGVIQPLIVRLVAENQYEIIAGERRWRAAKLAGLHQVPVIARQVDDETAMAMALIENLQREDLNAMDQARAMQRLSTEFSLTHQQIADLLGKSRAAVSNFLRLLTLDAEVRLLLEHGDIEMGHARALLALDKSVQKQAAQIIVARQLSVRDAEALVNRMKSGKPQKEKKESIPREYQQQLDQLSQHWGTKLNIKAGKKGKGQLVIHYENKDNLDNLLQRFSQFCE